MAMSDFNTLYFPSFTIGDGDMMSSVGTRWKKYVSRFDNFLVALNITDEKRKKLYFFISVVLICKIFMTLWKAQVRPTMP